MHFAPMSPLKPDPLSGQSLVVLGAGYVGEAVCREGLRRGMRVHALTRNADRAARLQAMGVKSVVAQLDQSDWHDALPPDADCSLNCVSSGGGGTDAYRTSYVQGTRSILEWGKRTVTPGLLIYTSSTSVYAQGDGARIDEEATAEGSGETGPILLEAEALTRSWAGSTAVVRLAGIYGPGRHQMLDQLRNGARVLPGRGDHRLNLIHRDDIVGAVFRIWECQRGKSGSWLYNLADNDPRPKAEVATWLARRLGVETPTFSETPAPGRRRLVPDRIILNSRIRTELGWSPVYPTFREGYEALLGA
ncbi:MAG: NAD-dependent epimerase/dehydratase family protein [Opitutaceae bacterium]|nr:NAD-dependent epimerase/dehydratase family protein [Opitutaceae bacterium]